MMMMLVSLATLLSLRVGVRVRVRKMTREAEEFPSNVRMVAK